LILCYHEEEEDEEYEDEDEDEISTISEKRSKRKVIELKESKKAKCTEEISVNNKDQVENF